MKFLRENRNQMILTKNTKKRIRQAQYRKKHKQHMKKTEKRQRTEGDVIKFNKDYVAKCHLLWTKD